jgi:DNA-directed RNA polymerase specialized sigma24 family protein
MTMPEFNDVFNDTGEQGGSPEAFKVLFFQYYPEILSFAVMCLGDLDHSVARTVTLEVFFLLWERRTDFDREKAIKAFLYLAVRNKCLHELPAGSRADLPPVIPPSSLPRDMQRDIFDYTDGSNFFAY